MATKMSTERDEAINRLHEWVKPGDTIQTIMRHVSRSGMQRSISLIATVNGEIVNMDYWIARALDMRIDQNNGGIKIHGAGMDMGFELVYQLGWKLYPDGFGCIGKDCRSNDHSNGDRDYTPDHVVHRDGGYALRHEWL